MDRKAFIAQIEKETKGSKQAINFATKYRPSQKVFTDKDVTAILSLNKEKSSPWPKGEPVNRASYGLARCSEPTGRFGGSGVLSDSYDDIDNHDTKPRMAKRHHAR